MTTVTASAGHALAAAVTTVPATGVLKASWLLLVFPLFGALVLLAGGRRTDRWGHLLGCAMPVASFVYGVIAFFVMVVAAAEVVVGLAILMAIYRARRSASVDDASLLKY